MYFGVHFESLAKYKKKVVIKNDSSQLNFFPQIHHCMHLLIIHKGNLQRAGDESLSWLVSFNAYVTTSENQ